MERKRHKSVKVRDRMYTIFLLYKGYSRSHCADILNLSYHTINNYIYLYQQRGLTRLRQISCYQPQSALQPFQSEITQAIAAIKPTSICELKDWIEQNCGLERSLESVRRFIRKLGFRYRKTNTFPGAKDFDKWEASQKEFKDRQLFPILKKAASAKLDLLFMDAAHFIQGRYNNYIWSQNPCYAPSAHGRYRINVLSGLDLAKGQVLSQYNDTYIRSESITQFFQWLREKHYPNKNRKLCLILDNARYQQCEKVKIAAKNCDIELVYLPAYSPIP